MVQYGAAEGGSEREKGRENERLKKHRRRQKMPENPLFELNFIGAMQLILTLSIHPLRHHLLERAECLSICFPILSSCLSCYSYTVKHFRFGLFTFACGSQSSSSLNLNVVFVVAFHHRTKWFSLRLGRRALFVFETEHYFFSR